MSATELAGPIPAATRIYSAAKAFLALLGLAALVAVTLPAPRELLLRQVRLSAQPEAAAAASTTLTGGTIQVRVPDPAQQREQRAIVEFIAKRYRVADEAAALFVATAYRAGQEFSVDPLLILAVAAIESRYNPVAESVLGAKGLMQIIPKFHLEKLHGHGGAAALLDPEVNILVGTQILGEYMRRFGEIETALQMYAGAFDEPTSQYANKVFTERARLEQVLVRTRRQA
jgi:soluble lytic murein transglycosylase-like protein